MVRFDWMAHVYDALAPEGETGELLETLDASEEDRTLDIGGGTGRISELIPGEVVVTDLSLNMMRKAKKKRPGLPLVRSTADHLPFPDDSFDRVLVTDAFHHFPDQTRCLDEFRRVLRPGGKFVVQEFNTSSPLGRLIRFGERYVLLYRPLRMFSPDELDAFLRENGYRTRKTHEDLATYIIEATPEPVN